MKGSGGSAETRGQLRPPAPHPHPGCGRAVPPPAVRQGTGPDSVPSQGAGPPPAQGEASARQPMTTRRGEAAEPRRTECAKPPVPAHQDTPPLGTKCVLCQLSSLPNRRSCRCSICSGGRPGGPARGRKPSADKPPHSAGTGAQAAPGPFTDTLQLACVIGS